MKMKKFRNKIMQQTYKPQKKFMKKPNPIQIVNDLEIILENSVSSLKNQS